MHKKKLTLMHPGAEVSRNFTDIFVMLVYMHQLLVVCSSGIRYNSCSGSFVFSTASFDCRLHCRIGTLNAVRRGLI